MIRRGLSIIRLSATRLHRSVIAPVGYRISSNSFCMSLAGPSPLITMAESSSTDATTVKVTVRNVGRWVDKKRFEKMLTKLDIKFRHAKKGAKSLHGIVSFDTEQEKSAAMEVLKTATNKKGELFKVEDFVKEAVSLDEAQKRAKRTNVAPKSVEESSSPWFNVPYEEQLNRKQSRMLNVVRRIVKALEYAESRTASGALPTWLEDRKKLHGSFSRKAQKKSSAEDAGSSSHNANEGKEEDVGDLPGTCCTLERILPSPLTHGYRNKCTFTIGLDSDGAICVGLRTGKFRSGSCEVGDVSNSALVSGAMKALLKAVLPLLKASKYPVYSLEENTGFFRTLFVRHFESTKSLQVMLVVNPTGITQEEIKLEMACFIKGLTESEYEGNKVVSFCLQQYEGSSTPSVDHPIETLFGPDSIVDILGGIKFSVSPAAFFQTNSPATKVLYDKVTDLACEGKVSKDVTIVDVCCGTGTIGLSVAEKVKNVVGIDSCNSAIVNARLNATENGISNACFVAAFVEDVVKQIFENKFLKPEETKLSGETGKEVEAAVKLLQLGEGDCVAIVDPPRCGLHRRVIRELRCCPAITRLVYVSCNPTGSFVENTVALCRVEHKQRPGKAFRPVKSVPVDLFPHTEHCELVTLFEKIV